MKKHVALLLAAVTAASLWVQGCSKPAAKEETAVETTVEDTTKEETTAEETTAAEETEAAETEAADASSEAGQIPAEYEKYLSWTSAEWTAADAAEKEKAMIAYILYDAIVYQGLKDAKPADFINAPEFSQIKPALEQSFANMGENTMKDICDMGHSATNALDDLDIPADIKESLSCTAKDWEAASDDEKTEIAKSMVVVVGMMIGEDVDMEMLEGMDEEIAQQVAQIDSLFGSGLYGDMTLYDMLNQMN